MSNGNDDEDEDDHEGGQDAPGFVFWGFRVVVERGYRELMVRRS